MESKIFIPPNNSRKGVAFKLLFFPLVNLPKSDRALHGNEHSSMTEMPHLQNMEWDFAEGLSHITRGTTEAYYNYDGSGERVRKVVKKSGITETRLYLGGFEIFRKKVGGNLELERETLHIMDFGRPITAKRNEEESNTKDEMSDEANGRRRIAVIETKTWENSVSVTNSTPLLRYQFDNHLGSATLELDESANIISYEEYYPYGDTSYQAGRSISEVRQKRYRYTGKEKDDENGLYYLSARYYSSMIGIFISVDPKLEKYPGVSSYAYCLNNPIKYIDPDGKEIKLVGTIEERQVILDHLQRLTNDRLNMRDDGTVIITRIGGENTDKYLRRGSELIRELNRKGAGAKTVTIVISSIENAVEPVDRDDFGEPDWTNATNRTGTDAIIQFTINANPPIEVQTLVDPDSEITSLATRPDEIGLAHELIHAYNINRGIVDFRQRTYNFLTDTGPDMVTEPKEEFITVGLPGYDGRRFTENKIRKEQGLKQRGAY